MDAIETAIRNAFDKGDRFDPAYRQRVYRSAAAAMEKALQANPNLSPEAAERRRESVHATIDQIESEFAPAVPPENAAPVLAEREAPPVEAHPAPPLSADRRDINTGFPAPPVIDAETRGANHPEQGIETEFPRQETRRHDDFAAAGGPVQERPRGRGGWLVRLLPSALVLLLAAAAVWWALSSGFLAPGSDQAEAPIDPAASDGPAADDPPANDTPQNWITVFSPDDPTQVTALAAASAEVTEDDSGRFIRIRSGPEGAPVGFGVGQGVLESITGRRAVFNIVARSEEATPVEIAVECDFGGLGDCGRKRYSVNYERGDFLFEVELPEGRPAAAGAISVVADVDGGGKAIDIYEIRVSVD